MPTSNIKDTSRIRREFSWGPVTDLHEVGPYIIVEFHPEIFEDSCGTGKHDFSTTKFHAYVDGEDTCREFFSLDAALVGAISIRHEGCNSHAGEYFMKMIATED